MTSSKCLEQSSSAKVGKKAAVANELCTAVAACVVRCEARDLLLIMISMLAGLPVPNVGLMRVGAALLSEGQTVLTGVRVSCSHRNFQLK